MPAAPAGLPTRLLARTEQDLAWRDDGLCRQSDPDIFFPDPSGSTRRAKQVCQACPVTTACLQYALGHDERFGVWGGLDEQERRQLQNGGATRRRTRRVAGVRS
jgi:WhiB family transcriptional regulator, redox-sensing transcriptional regulator